MSVIFSFAPNQLASGSKLGPNLGGNFKLQGDNRDQSKVQLNSQKYQPSGEGGTRSPPATPHRLQNPKWPPGGPKMPEGVWKGVYP